MDASTVTHDTRCHTGAIRRQGRIATWVLMSAIMLACGSEQEDFTAVLDAHHFYESLTIANHAINMATAAPYDTLQLPVAAIMKDGTPVPGTIVYATKDTAIQVSPTGHVTALHPTAGAIVHASLTYNGLTRSDSTVIAVHDGAPTLVSALAFSLAPGDSAKLPYLNANIGPGTKVLTLNRLDADGQSVPGIVTALTVSDTTYASVTQAGNLVTVTAKGPGRITVYAATSAYGTVVRDSFSLVIGWPIAVLEGIYARTLTGTQTKVLGFFPDTIRVGVGGTVCWQNSDTTYAIDVTFDDSLQVAAATGRCALLGQRYPGGGNIPPWKNSPTDLIKSYAGRSFPHPGRYPFHSTINGTGGVIIVCDELHDSSCFPW